MFVKVVFHGILKKLCPNDYTVDANTPAEAIRGVSNQLRDKLIRKDGHRFVCMVKECPNQIQLTSTLRNDELNIYPAFMASGGGGSSTWVQIGIGSLMILGAVFLGPGGLAAAMTLANWGAWSAAFAVMGAGIILSGLAQMLAPKVDTAKAVDNPESSRTFGNNGNTTKIGTRIPIGYGLYKVAGQYLSVDTEAVDRGGSVSSGFAMSSSESALQQIISKVRNSGGE